MPRVPTYDNLQTTPTAAPAAAYQAPSGPSGEMLAADQLQRAGQAAVQAGSAASSIALDAQREANELRVNDAMNQYVQAQTQARVEALSLKGKNALERPDGKSLPDEFGERMQGEAARVAQSLANPMQRQMFAQVAARQDTQFRGALTQHMVEQQQVYRKETQKATIETAVNQGTLLWGDEALRAQSVSTITRVVDAIAKDHGMSPEARGAALVESLSPLHAGVLKGMLQAGQANDAKAYYNENSASMTLQARAAMQDVIKHASDVQTGEAQADAVWALIGPKVANEPVKIFDMEREVRAQLKTNPDAMKQGIDALRQRAQAFNAQQAESNAAGVNAVFKLIDGKVPMSTVMRSAEWLDLPDLKKHEIRKALDNEAHQAEQRAFTAEQRAFTAEQRKDRQMLLNNGDAYMRYSDPDVLARMTRPQVEATRTVFGFEGAQHLLSRFDALQKPGAIAEARIDKQDFDHVAEQMGLDPFNAKAPEKKKALGELQFRVEQLINSAQQSKKQVLTREEKMALMQGELSRTVQVGRFFPDNVPVIQLSPDQVDRVRVPAAQRDALAAEMKALYAVNKNPAFEPTTTNLQRYYLHKQSRAADLISPTK